MSSDRTGLIITYIILLWYKDLSKFRMASPMMPARGNL